MFFFFFSSRRRHTRLQGDWSSDVCSSDLFGYLGACTQRLELVTGIVILPQRQTALVAKQAAAVDVLTGGRLRLGGGIGWEYVEDQAPKEDFHTPGPRGPEQITGLRQLLAQPGGTLDGGHHPP